MRERDEPVPTHPTVVGHQRKPARPDALPINPAGSTVSWNPEDTPEQDAADAPAGPLLRRVAQFVLLERLGAGGMGVVFAAYDEKLERKVAIKLVATGGGERAQQRLLREAQAQGRLSHPNVVTVYEVGTLPEGQLFIAMELVKGQTLRAWQAKTRAWSEIVAHYAAAGDGLAAAHRAGIVHRDFKPDNVLIGDDRRVRVADFGLAFAAETTPPPDPDDSSISSRGSRPLPLTVAGAVVGTPGYMAPEQFAGAAVDARSDQFSFCVALYEALHGDRPNADFAFLNGARPAPRRSEPDPAYPRWLWDVLTRGLAHDPGARFPSMDALLAELTRSRERNRRRALLGAGVLGVLATAGVASAALLGGRAPDPCPRAVGELAGVWDPLAKPRVHAALLSTGAAFAPAVWTSTEAAFDRYARHWVDAQQAACAATHVRHVQSPELLDRRIECLADRRRSLAAAADVLQSRPAQAVAHAGEVLASLGDIDLCADTGVLLQLGPSTAPTSPVQQARTAEVRGYLAKASALLSMGDVTAVDPLLATVQQRSADLHDDALRADVAFLDARTRLQHRDVTSATALFSKASDLAIASHHDELPADIWLSLAANASSLELRPAEVEPWLARGEAWLRRLAHDNDPRWIDAEYARGKLELTAGNAHKALTTLSQAISGAEARWGTSDARLIRMLRDRAVVHAKLGDGKSAVADGNRALALGIATWGPDYPDIASTRRVLGLIYIEQLGDGERGAREITAALRIYRNQLGDDSIEVANCEQALSQAGQFRGDYAAALEHAERAAVIYAKKLGADHPRYGEALVGLGVLRFMRKDYVGSLAAYQAAYPIARAALGEAHGSVGLMLSNTGETLLALGRPNEAQANFERALPIMTRALTQDHVDLALPLKGLGLAHLNRGTPAESIPYFERALELRTRDPAASDPQELAEIRWGLARALHRLGREPVRVRELTQAAIEGYRSLGAESAPHVAELSRWLAALPAAR